MHFNFVGLTPNRIIRGSVNDLEMPQMKELLNILQMAEQKEPSQDMIKRMCEINRQVISFAIKKMSMLAAAENN